MDIGAVRLALTGVRGEVARIRSATRNSPDTVAGLVREADALDRRLERIQQWLARADGPTQARLRGSLGQVGHTIYVALDGVKQLLTFVHTETDVQDKGASIRRCSTELHECVLLADFTLNVFSLPTGSEAQRETENLRLAARTLYDAQGRSGHHRIRALQSPRSTRTSSNAFRMFIERVLEAETNLTNDHEQSPGDGSCTSGDTHVAGYSRCVDRDELHLPPAPTLTHARSGEATSCYPEARRRSRQLSYPASPREVSEWHTPPSHPEEQTPPVPPKETPSQEPQPRPRTPEQKIARRPVARASTVPLSPITVRSSSPVTLPPSPDRRRSQTMTSRMKSRIGRRTGTRELFTQASTSLSHLTNELEGAEPNDHVDLPPPYAEGANPAPPPQDEKRPHAPSVSSTASKGLSTFALVQDNLLEELQTRVKRGHGINEVDPLTKRTALMEAADLDRTSMIGLMVKVTNQVRQKDVDGNSALHFAAQQGNAATCNALLDAGASVEDYNRQGETPISIAARGGHTDAVDCLLNSWTIQRGTAAALTKGYLEALKSGNVNTVAAFIERHIKPKKIKETVLCAAEGGSVPTLDYVLAQKADLKQRNPNGWTALHFAAEQGHIAMVEKLLALGVSWKAETKKVGETALAIAIRNRQTATANALILHKDAKVNRDDNDGVTPLHHAVRIGELGLMTTLLNAGAKLDVQSKYGWSVMHTAAAYGHTHLVAELITRGVSVEEKLAEAEVYHAPKTNEGARRGYWAEIRWPHTAARPLHLSLEFGHDEVANLLIAAGAKIDAADGKGWRPLHYAAFSARPAIVELLLNKGASPHATTDDNNTPLSLGFRVYGLDASEDDKVHVWELLQGAMNATKKSKMKRLGDFMSGSSAGRQVERRNRVWHTAELAASLHLEVAEHDGSEGEGERSMGNGQDLSPTVSGRSFARDERASPR